MRNAQKLHSGLSALGLKVASEVSPVVAVVAPDPQVAAAFWHALLDAGVYVNLALPPATPYGYSLLRASLCAAHTEEQIDEVISIFANVATSLGLIDAPRKRAVAR
jgi:8-amino-7-oxononanoate synthase